MPLAVVRQASPDPPVLRVVLDKYDGAVDADALVGRTVSWMSCVMDVVYVGVLCRLPIPVDRPLARSDAAPGVVDASKVSMRVRS